MFYESKFSLRPGPRFPLANTCFAYSTSQVFGTGRATGTALQTRQEHPKLISLAFSYSETLLPWGFTQALHQNSVSTYLYLFLGKQKQKPNSSHIYIHSGSLSVITVSSSSWHFTDGTGRVRRLTNRSHRQHRTRWLIRFLIPSARLPCWLVVKPSENTVPRACV